MNFVKVALSMPADVLRFAKREVTRRPSKSLQRVRERGCGRKTASGTPDARAIAATVRELAEAIELPLPGDVEAVVPVHSADIVEQHTGLRAGQVVWLPRRHHLRQSFGAVDASA